jgi:hypothetical protein
MRTQNVEINWASKSGHGAPLGLFVEVVNAWYDPDPGNGLMRPTSTQLIWSRSLLIETKLLRLIVLRLVSQLLVDHDTAVHSSQLS